MAASATKRAKLTFAGLSMYELVYFSCCFSLTDYTAQRFKAALTGTSSPAHNNGIRPLSLLLLFQASVLIVDFLCCEQALTQSVTYVCKTHVHTYFNRTSKFGR